MTKKRICRYDLNGVLKASYLNVRVAAERTGGQMKCIKHAISGILLSHMHYQWRCTTSERNIAPIQPWKNMKRVGGYSRRIQQLDLDGNFIREFESVSEAARVVKGRQPNIVKAARSDQRLTGYGYRWKYSSKLHDSYKNRLKK